MKKKDYDAYSARHTTFHSPLASLLVGRCYHCSRRITITNLGLGFTVSTCGVREDTVAAGWP